MKFCNAVGASSGQLRSSCRSRCRWCSPSRRPTPGSAAAGVGVRGARERFRCRRGHRPPGHGATVQSHHHPAGSPGLGAPASAGGGFFNRPGRGMLGGLAAGFLGAGLFGMLFGGGMFGGLGGLSSLFGLILQIGLIIVVVRLAMSWWQRRNQTASAYAGAAADPRARASFRSGMGFGPGSASTPLEIQPADYQAFERLLGEIQAAWSNEDVARLHTLATPEMVSYFAGTSRRTRPAAPSTRSPTSSCCRVTSPKPGARATPIRQRGDALLAGRQDHRPLQRPAGRRQRSADRTRRVDLRAAARLQLGAVGHPAACGPARG